MVLLVDMGTNVSDVSDVSVQKVADFLKFSFDFFRLLGG